MGASDYRDLYRKVSADFPGEYGAVPPELLEAIVNLESGGVATAQTGTATGLGQIMPTGLEYNAAVSDQRFVSKFGNAPNLYDPEQNIAVMTIGLAARHDAGVASRLDGGYGTWADWYGTSLGYFGAVGNDNDPATNAPYSETFTPEDSALNNRDTNINGREYLNRIGEYVAYGSGADTWKAYSDIDKLGPGSFHPLTGAYDHDALYTKADEIGGKTVWSWVSDTGKEWAVKGADAVDSATDSVGNAVKSAIMGIVRPLIDFAPRGGFILLGSLLVIGAVAVWSI